MLARFYTLFTLGALCLGEQPLLPDAVLPTLGSVRIRPAGPSLTQAQDVFWYARNPIIQPGALLGSRATSCLLWSTET